MEKNEKIKFLQQMFETSAEGVLIIAQDGKVLWINAVVKKTDPNLLGQNVREIIEGVTWPPITDKPIRRFINGVTVEYIVTLITGTDYWLINARNLDDKNGIKVEMENKFFLTLSQFVHDLKSPLNSVIGFLDIILEELSVLPEQEENSGYLKTALECAENVVNSISNFLAVSRLENGENLIEKEDINLISFIGKNKEMNTPYCKKFGIEISLKPSMDSTDFYVLGDKKLLDIALNNMIINAVEEMAKENQPKKITIFFGKKNDKAWITVANPGTISKENLQKIFIERFSQKPKGNGLGTRAIRKIAEAHNGTASAKCENGMVYITMTFPAN